MRRVLSLVTVILALSPSLHGAADGTVGGVVSDHLDVVSLAAGDVTYSRDSVGEANCTALPDGTWYQTMEGDLSWTIRVDIQGYAEEERVVPVPAGGNDGTIDFDLTRTSVLDSLIFVGDPSEMFEGEVIVGTITLSEAFAKSATEVVLSLPPSLVGQVEFRDDGGTPLVDDGGSAALDVTVSIPAGDTSVNFQLAALADTDAESDVAMVVEADAASIPSGGDHVEGPSITLRDIKRVVTISFDGEPGTVGRYTDLAAALAGTAVPTSEVETLSGEATFKGEDTDVPAGFHYEPTGGTKPTSN